MIFNIRPQDVTTVIQKKELVRKYRESGQKAEEFATQNGISRATLYRYTKRESEKGIAALADNRGQNHGRFLKINDEVTTWLLAFFADHPQAGVAGIHRALVSKCKEHAWSPCPSYWWVDRFLKKISKDVKVALQKGAKARIETAALTVPRKSFVPNSLWQIDASEVPVWAFNPLLTSSKVDDSANYIKPWVISVVDTSTRVAMALHAFAKEPTSADALFTLRKAIACSDDPRKFAYGKPLACNTDNHKIFHPSGDWGQSLLMAGIDPQSGPNDSPHANGKCERLFWTLTRRIWQLLSSYADQHQALAKAKKTAIPWVLFQSYLDRMVYENYHLVEHSELSKSPFEAWGDSLSEAAGLLYNVPEVDLALRVSKELKVATDGIQVAPLRRYTGPFLEGIVDSKIVVRTPPAPEPLPDKLPVYQNGIYLGDVTCMVDDSIAKAIRETRLQRSIDIAVLQKSLVSISRKDKISGDPWVKPQMPAEPLKPIDSPSEEPIVGLGAVPEIKPAEDDPVL